MSKQEQLDKISQYVRDLLQEKFGQPLMNCEAFMGSNYLVFYIRGFISSMERVLVGEGQTDAVFSSRGLIIQSLVHEMKGVIQLQLGVTILEFYNDWNYENNTGMIIAVLQEGQEFSQPPGEWQGLGAFEAEVKRLSAVIQKKPEKTMIVPLAPRILLVQRDGILILIEKALIAKGYEKELKLTKSELEKNYFHQSAQFELILNRSLEDVFVDWNLHEDRSLMCFVWK